MERHVRSRYPLVAARGAGRLEGTRRPVSHPRARGWECARYHEAPHRVVLLTRPSAEGEGFEPSVDRKAHNGFRDRPVQPLRHPSEDL
jgi:hypothetical protein